MRRRPARQQHVAFAEIDAGGTDVPARCRGLRDGDGVAVAHRVFLDHHGVGAVGDHAAGEDARRFAGANRAIERPARRDLADHLEPAR